MNLIVNIVISIAVAAVATAITTWYSGDTHAALLLFVAFSGATIATALLVLFASRKAAPAQQGRKKSPRTQKSPDKPTSRASSSDGPREEGQVKWFNVSKGFGFITKDDGEEIFVHFRSILGGGRRGLKDGQRVSFVVADSDKGPQAEDVEGVN